MGVCDLCSASGEGTRVSSEDMRKAVFKRGFNPFALGLTVNPLAAVVPINPFEGWKNTIVSQDTSDWNICARCMPILSQYLEGKPTPTGISKSTVSTNPRVGQLAAKEVEEKYKRKKRWQFWKR